LVIYGSAISGSVAKVGVVKAVVFVRGWSCVHGKQISVIYKEVCSQMLSVGGDNNLWNTKGQNKIGFYGPSLTQWT